MTAVVAIDVRVVDPVDAGDVLRGVRWGFSAVALSPERARAAARDQRHRTAWVVASTPDGPVGVLPVYRLRSPQFPDPSFDPRAVVPAVAAVAPADPRELLLVGGLRDLVAGALVRADLPREYAAMVRGALVRGAFAYAGQEGLFPVALYVHDAEAADFRAALGPATRAAEIDRTAVLDVRGGSGPEYLAALPTSKRRTNVRRDWRRLDVLGLRATEVDPAGIIDEAAPLVAAIKARHGMVEHERLAAMRLRGWLAHDLDGFTAFAVRDSLGVLLGVQFACRDGNAVELQEIGIADGEWWHLVYTEVMVYAPLRYAWRHRCRTLRMGTGALTAKGERGASTRPVWAIW